jgi:hypothetical protein
LTKAFNVSLANAAVIMPKKSDRPKHEGDHIERHARLATKFEPLEKF